MPAVLDRCDRGFVGPHRASLEWLTNRSACALGACVSKILKRESSNPLTASSLIPILIPMAIVHEGSAPYAPASQVLKAISHYREKGAAQFSKELLMRLGMPAAYANRTLSALKLLDLVDEEGTPTTAFTELQRASESEYKPRLEQILRTAYGEVFQVVDPAKDPEQAIEDAFRFYEPRAQRGKMLTLFLALAEEAGIVGADKAPRKRMRTVRTDSGRKRLVGENTTRTADPKPKHEDPPPPAPPKPPASEASSAEALRLRYIDMLMKKVDSQDEIDTGLLDRIEALLYEKRSGNGEPKD
jgi:Family of unknown function (DUF5343)